MDFHGVVHQTLHRNRAGDDAERVANGLVDHHLPLRANRTGHRDSDTATPACGVLGEAEALGKAEAL